MINTTDNPQPYSSSLSAKSWPYLSSKCELPKYTGQPYTEIIDHGFSILKHYVKLDYYVRANIKEYLSESEWSAFVNEVRIDISAKWPNLYFTDGIIPSNSTRKLRLLFKQYNGIPFTLKPMRTSTNKSEYNLYDNIVNNKKYSIGQPLNNFSLCKNNNHRISKKIKSGKLFNGGILNKLKKKYNEKIKTKQRNYDRYNKMLETFIDPNKIIDNFYHDYDDYEYHNSWIIFDRYYLDNYYEDKYCY